MISSSDLLAAGPAPRRWPASLELRLAERAGATRVVGRRQRGPLALQRPLYPEGGVAHLYLLHPPGGVVGGDSLDIRLHAESDATCLITTPGAAKFYRGNGFAASQSQVITVDDATMEWFPQENIFFDGAVVDIRTDIRLRRGSRLFAWELNCFGRAASKAWFDSGRLCIEMRVSVEQKLLLLERLRLVPGEGAGTGAVGLRGHSVQAMLLVYPATQQLLDSVRAMVVDASFPCAATLLESLLVLRCLGHDAARVRSLLVSVWSQTRFLHSGRDAVIPRIWLT